MDSDDVLLRLLSLFLAANSLEKETILNIHYCKIPLCRTQGASFLGCAWACVVLVLQYSEIPAHKESVGCRNVNSKAVLFTNVPPEPVYLTSNVSML
jgi:hypothetical protein